MTATADFRVLAEQVSAKHRKPCLDPILVLRSVATHFGVTIEELQGRGRTRFVSLARRTATHLLLELCGLKLTQVGHLLRRDHTTIIWHREQALEDMERSPAWAAALEVMTREIQDEANRRETNGQ